MRIITQIGFIFSLCIFSACSFIAKTAHHAKRPKPETPVTIVEWLEKHGIHNKSIVTIEPASYYSAIFMYSQGPMIFNKKGELVSVGYNYDGKFCPKGVDEFLKSLYPGFEKDDEHLSNYILSSRNGRPDTSYPVLDDISSFGRDLYGNRETSFIKSANVDYILMLPFSIFMGNTVQVKKIKTFINAVGENQTAKINILLVNFDKQMSWGEEWLNKISIEI